MTCLFAPPNRHAQSDLPPRRPYDSVSLGEHFDRARVGTGFRCRSPMRPTALENALSGSACPAAPYKCPSPIIRTCIRLSWRCDHRPQPPIPALLSRRWEGCASGPPGWERGTGASEMRERAPAHRERLRHRGLGALSRRRAHRSPHPRVPAMRSRRIHAAARPPRMRLRATKAAPAIPGQGVARRVSPRRGRHVRASAPVLSGPVWSRTACMAGLRGIPVVRCSASWPPQPRRGYRCRRS